MPDEVTTRASLSVRGLEHLVRPPSLRRMAGGAELPKFETIAGDRVDAKVGDATVSIASGARFTFGSGDFRHEATPTVLLTLREATSIADVERQFLTPLHWLFSFLFAKHVEVLEIAFEKEDEWIRAALRQPEEKKPIHHIDQIFSGDLMLERVIPEFFRLLEDHSSALALLFSLRAAPPKYQEMQYLAVARLIREWTGESDLKASAATLASSEAGALCLPKDCKPSAWASGFAQADVDLGDSIGTLFPYVERGRWMVLLDVLLRVGVPLSQSDRHLVWLRGL